jgi:hypothetical protein
METYFYIAILIIGIVSCPFIFVILGKPRIKAPWRPSAIVDAKLSGDDETQKILDECERAIS